MTLKNADVSKNLVTSYGFSGWHFFQEVLAHTHAKYLGKWLSGTVIFRVGVNLPPPPPPPSLMIESEHLSPIGLSESSLDRGLVRPRTRQTDDSLDRGLIRPRTRQTEDSLDRGQTEDSLDRGLIRPRTRQTEDSLDRGQTEDSLDRGHNINVCRHPII